jgi:hypothetical protein
MFDFSFPYFSGALSWAEYAYNLQAINISLDFIDAPTLSQRLGVYAQELPTVLLLPQSYSALPFSLEGLTKIYLSSSGKTEAQAWNALLPYKRAILLPVAPTTGEALDVEEIIFSIKSAYPYFEIALDITFLLGVEPFYFDFWQIDIAFCYLDNQRYLWAFSQTAKPNFPSALGASFQYDYLPQRWNRNRRRALQFRDFLKQNGFVRQSALLQTFAFTIFSFPASVSGSYFADRLQEKGWLLPAVNQQCLLVSHLPAHYEQSIIPLQNTLMQMIAELC